MSYNIVQKGETWAVVRKYRDGEGKVVEKYISGLSFINDAEALRFREQANEIDDQDKRINFIMRSGHTIEVSKDLPRVTVLPVREKIEKRKVKRVTTIKQTRKDIEKQLEREKGRLAEIKPTHTERMMKKISTKKRKELIIFNIRHLTKVQRLEAEISTLHGNIQEGVDKIVKEKDIKRKEHLQSLNRERLMMVKRRKDAIESTLKPYKGITSGRDAYDAVKAGKAVIPREED